MSVKIIAHRAGTDKYPELTIDAAKNSLKLGADIIEVDIRITRDNIPVVNHCPDGVRLFGEPCVIKEITAKEFLKFRYLKDISYSSITLENVFQEKISPLLLHIKDTDVAYAPIFDCIKKYNYSSNVILGIVDSKLVSLCRECLPKTQILLFIKSLKDLNESLNLNVDIVRLWEPWVNPELVKKIQSAGKEIWVMSGHPKVGDAGYTTTQNFKSCFEMGVDGILINEVSFAKNNM